MSLRLAVEQLIVDFEEHYPLEYIRSCSVSTVGVYDDSVAVAEQEKPCILVLLEAPLPVGCYLPNEFKGVRVFIQVIGGPPPYVVEN